MSYKFATIIITCLLFFSFQSDTNFKEEQLKHPRVKVAYSDYGDIVAHNLKTNNIENVNIFIRAFKKEEILELWGKNTNDNKFKLLRTFNICLSSGALGPKRKQGDYQVPEGFYNINVFNPKSRFFLSLGIDYPNKSDRILGSKQKLGGNIFIHGNCLSIGCIPITDECIEELYVYAVEAKNNNQLNIPVHVFPARLTNAFIENYKDNTNNNHTNFWKNLKKGYDYFELHKALPNITVSQTGNYLFD